MKLNTKVNVSLYKPDSIENGRLAKQFFLDLTEGLFNQAEAYWQTSEEWAGISEMPLLFQERNLYSHVASAINRLTPLHASEWTLSKSNTGKDADTRRVDFWCCHKAKESGKALNYYIEVKKGYYCLNEGTKPEFTKNVEEGIQKLVTQSQNAKKHTPAFADLPDVHIGLQIIHGYHAESKKPDFDEKQVLDNIAQIIDGRAGAQLLMNTWFLPPEREIQWDKDLCKFIAVAGIVISKKR